MDSLEAMKQLFTNKSGEVHLSDEEPFVNISTIYHSLKLFWEALSIYLVVLVESVLCFSVNAFSLDQDIMVNNTVE